MSYIRKRLRSAVTFLFFLCSISVGLAGNQIMSPNYAFSTFKPSLSDTCSV